MKLLPLRAAPDRAVPRALLRISRGGQAQALRRPLAAEHHMVVRLEGRPPLSLVCTPGGLAELILGRLYTGGVIAAPAEVSRIRFSPDETRAWVSLSPAPGRAAPPLRPLSPIPWRPEWIFSMADALEAELPLYSATHAVHSCLLSIDGQLLCRQEDLGRHNALDRAVGQALRLGLPLERAILYTSGRVPADMAEKVIRAGIPVLAAKAAPTERAVALAAQWGLTLIGGARRDGLELYWPPKEGGHAH